MVKPRKRGDLTKHFDALEVDLEPKDFTDYNRLKKALLKNDRMKGIKRLMS